MSAPAWAQRLVAEVLEAEGIKPGTTTLSWSRPRHSGYVAQWHRERGRPVPRPHSSSGRANRFRLHVSAGADPGDQRIVLLHELAHVIDHRDYLDERHGARTSPGSGARERWAGHGEPFWRIAWRLYRAHHGHVPLRRFLAREDDHRTALSVAMELGIPGAWAHARRLQPIGGPRMSTTASTTKRCPGIPKFGEAAHDAPVAEFTRSKAYPDGLERLCKMHDRQYQAAWRAAKAAKAAGEAPATVAPAKPAPAPEPEPEINGESPSVTKRRQKFERELAKAKTLEEREELVASAAREAEEGRRATWREAKRRQRAAAKAARLAR